VRWLVGIMRTGPHRTPRGRETLRLTDSIAAWHFPHIAGSGHFLVDLFLVDL
jgi:hypothetical protein